jgi:hypothetical protein
MIKDNQLSLFEKLNDPIYTKKLSQFNITFQSWELLANTFTK